MALIILTKLTNPEVEVYINPLKIVSMKRKLKPNTSLELLQTLYPTQIMLEGGNSALVDESPEEIIEAIKASQAMNWSEEKELSTQDAFDSFNEEEYKQIVEKVRKVL